MSTLKLENIKHENSSTNNMVMDSDGSTRTTGIHKVDSRLQVGNSSITQAYPQNNFGYVADFQGSAGTQTFISIAAPGVSLGNNGVIIGEDATDTYITQRGNKNIKLTTQDVTRVNIDGTGKVTMPYQPSFMVRGTSGQQSFGAGSVSATGFYNATVLHNVGNHYNTTNGTFTAPVDGRYHMALNLYTQTTGGTAGGYVGSHIRFSNLGDVYCFAENGSDVNLSFSGVFNMSANDTAFPMTYGHSGRTQHYLGQHSYFSGHLIG